MRLLLLLRRKEDHKEEEEEEAIRSGLTPFWSVACREERRGRRSREEGGGGRGRREEKRVNWNPRREEGRRRIGGQRDKGTSQDTRNVSSPEVLAPEEEEEGFRDRRDQSRDGGATAGATGATGATARPRHRHGGVAVGAPPRRGLRADACPGLRSATR